MKPASMSLKEWLIKKLSLQIMVPENVINAVISNQFETANTALALNDSVELSGFGTFHFNQRRAIKRMKKYEGVGKAYMRELREDEISETRRKNLEMKVTTLEINAKNLKPRIHES